MDFKSQPEKVWSVFKHQLEIVNARFRGTNYCHACGFTGKRKFKRVLWPELIAQWELSPEWVNWFDEREGSYCVNCHSSLRTNQLATALIKGFNLLAGVQGKSLKDVCRDPGLSGMKVAEINSAGTIHQFLGQLPGLSYSEYGSQLPEIRSENLESLSYSPSHFDMVVTSETLEHVPDFEKALAEIYRVLKPGGLHIFTIPVVWDKPATRVRAKIENNVLVNILPPSYHGAPDDDFEDYLVFSEFGSDAVDTIRNAGFDVELIQDAENKALVTFFTRKPAH
ncbi:MAG: hypothetical protein RLY85_306 [Bacteroidota bacterium]|jgi:SAM-dependent methyltransferase